MPSTAFIIGANRGIGLRFVQKFSEEGWDVFASVRPQAVENDSITELKMTGAKIFLIDYLDEDTIAGAAKEYGSKPLDCLINCAGVSNGPVRWQEYDSAMLTTWFQIMVVGPLLATKYFLASLEKSKGGKVINISSKLGSIGLNYSGTKIGYRLAKSALNQETRTIAMDLKNRGSKVMVIAISPGWIKTRLSNWLGDIDISDAVNGMFTIIENLTMAETGNFWSWTGEKLAY